MPESNRRKGPKFGNVARPRKSVVPKITAADLAAVPSPLEKRSRNPLRELESPPQVPTIRPASYNQVIVAMSKLDPLEQEVMLAQRLAVMPSPGDPENMPPVHIERAARAPWAHSLRKLGIFVIPELATHELVAPDRTGVMQNHTAMSLRKLGPGDLWKVAREANPKLAKMVDEAKTPEERRVVMAKLLKRIPAAQRAALSDLLKTTPDDLEPV